MEFIEGAALAAELKQTPLALERTARHGSQITDAPAEARAVGIVNLDFNPFTIMLTRHGVKVLDFGLAKIALKNQTGSETDIAATGGVRGLSGERPNPGRGAAQAPTVGV